MAGDTRNPLDVLEDDEDEYELRPAKKKNTSFPPDWELVLPSGKIFPIASKETAVMISLMKILSRDFENRTIVLRRKRYGVMEECDWKKLAYKPKDRATLKEQVELLLDIVNQKLQEKKE
ncbi:MAG: hypothetical protein Q7T50_05240 [Candidatus Magasanikbacteria bacterium]|nr:hypothetical protein [Candidatus Magasanikbacteria bacterium]